MSRIEKTDNQHQHVREEKPSSPQIEIQSITEAILAVKKFTGNTTTQILANIILDKLNQLKRLTLLLPLLDRLENEEIEKEIEETITFLTHELIKLANDRNLAIEVDGKLFTDTLYQVSLALAEARPINTIDFSTQYTIIKENVIYTSDRYQFDINSLVTWISRQNTFINPFNRQLFTPRDIQQIKDFAKVKGLDRMLDLSPITFSLSAMDERFGEEKSDQSLRYFVNMLHQQFRREALEELRDTGLTEAHLPINEFPKFVAAHRVALIYLLREKKLTPQQATQQIIGLNQQMVFSLKELYDYGLRGDHLRSWQGYQYPSVHEQASIFNYEHNEALTYLIKEVGVNIREAIQQVSGLSPDMANALKMLYIYGLRKEHFRYWQGYQEIYTHKITLHISHAHREVLIYLIKEQRVTLEEAFQRMNGLNSYQVGQLVLVSSSEQSGLRGQTQSRQSLSSVNSGVGLFNVPRGRLDNITELRRYLENSREGTQPSLTLPEVVSMSSQQVSNLDICYYVIEAGLLTIEQVKDLSENERGFFESAHYQIIHGEISIDDLMERFQSLRNTQSP